MPHYNYHAGPSHSRAHSEPPATSSIDAELAPPIKRSQSHWDFPHMPVASDWSCPAVEEVYESIRPRPVSPVATDIDDPEPEYIERKLHTIGAKIRDFAYEKTGLKQIPELFDQFDAISEFEYKLAQRPRVYPIQGKTLRRLLIIGWIDEDEIEERCEEMDMIELRKVDSRPAWPFSLKFQDSKCTMCPTPEERYLHTQTRRFGFMRLDRVRRSVELENMQREKEADEAQAAMESIRKRDEKLKRPLSDEEDEDDISSEQKRRKLLEEEDEWDWSLPCSQQMMPLKQYPAPLSSYDPDIYPEAAGAIESQVQSQPRPVYESPPRIDTPPLEDTRPNALRRPNRGLKRTLDRTQTFTEL